MLLETGAQILIDRGQSRTKLMWLSGLVVTFLALAAAAFALPGQTRRALQDAPGVTLEGDAKPEVGSRAPDFELQAASGETIRMSAYRGRPVMINFWATWCGPCRVEMPAIQNRFERHRENGLVVLAVNFDESRETVLEFGKELGLTFPLLLDPGGEIQRRFLVRGYPTTFFIDEKGVITTEHIGAMTEGLLDEYLDGIVDGR